MKCYPITLLAASTLLLLAACSSGSSENPSADPIDDAPSESTNPSQEGETTGETTVAFDPAADLQEVTATFVNNSPFARSSTIDTSRFTAGGGYHAFRPKVFTEDGGSAKVLVQHFSSADQYDYFTWDTTSKTISESFSFSDDYTLNFSEDASTATYIENCTPKLFKPNESLTPISLDNIVPAGSCVDGATVSTNGDTAIFSARVSPATPAQPGNGTSALRTNRDVLVYKRGDGSVIELNAVTMPLSDSRIDQMIRYHASWVMSDDGSVAASAYQFLPSVTGDGVTRPYYTSPVVVDTSSGAATVVDVRTYNRDICSKCTITSPAHLDLSADGQSLWYLQASSTVNERTDMVSAIYHYDVASGVVTRPSLSSQAEDMQISDSGHQVAYRSANTVSVMDFDTGKHLLIDEKALRGCVQDVCEYENTRFTRSNPYLLSADGSTLVIIAIGTRANATAPQNVSELYSVDVKSGEISRLLPDSSVDDFLASDDGQHIAVDVSYKLDSGVSLDAGNYVLSR